MSTLLTLILPSQAFSELLLLHPEIKARLALSAEVMLTAKFIKRAIPFGRVNAEQARILASKMERRSVPAGAVVLRQGERGEECHLIRSGSVEVTAGVEGEGERSAIHGCGATDGPRPCRQHRCAAGGD